ncbi:hypothetical protein NKH63_26230 [Mesorhizobium sp. M0960]|uniref:hypothetical protein n=1 Tax=Mesorhizobium sp. M0960 TaxID=2957035 RepID=UPI003336591C
MFHKVMKSGCRAEEARLETAERLAKFLALIAVVSWRIFFVTMSARAKPDAAPDSILTFAEITALDQIDALPNATVPPTAHARRLPAANRHAWRLSRPQP